MASAEHERIMGVWWQSPQRGPRAEHFGHWMSNEVLVAHGADVEPASTSVEVGGDCLSVEKNAESQIVVLTFAESEPTIPTIPIQLAITFVV